MGERFDPYHKWLGIRPEEQPPDHYRLLGVAAFEDDPDVLENAADQRIRHQRDYQNGPHFDDCQRLLNQIVTAKLCLLDANRRAAYDSQLSSERSLAARQKPAAAPPPVVEDAPPVQHGPPPVRARTFIWLTQRVDWLFTPKGAVIASFLFVAITWVGISFLLDKGESPNQGVGSLSKVPPDQASAGEPVKNARGKLPGNADDPPVAHRPPVDEPSSEDDSTSETREPAGPISPPGKNPTTASTETAAPESEKVEDVDLHRPVYLRNLDTVETDLPDAVWQRRESVVNGRGSSNSIWMGPHMKLDQAFIATARFTLEDSRTRQRQLFGAVGIDDSFNVVSGPPSPVTFEICGDGDVLWRSRSLAQRGTLQIFSIDVSDIRVLELSSRSSSRELAQAVWIDPRYIEHSGTIDLLQRIDPQDHAYHGDWSFENGSLVSPTSVHAQLSVPFIVPRAYQLEIVSVRERGESLSIGLVAEGVNFNAAFDVLAGDDWYSGLMLVDGKPVQENRLSHQGRILREGEPATITITVRGEAVTLAAEGTQILEWEEEIERLSLFDGWLPCEPGELFIGTNNASVRISKFELRPLPERINLLEWIDPARDSVRGDFALKDEQLVFPGVKGGHLTVPCRVPENYLLTTVLQDHADSSVPQIDLVVSGRRASLVMDGYGLKCGIEKVDGRSYYKYGGNATTFDGPILYSDAPTTIACKVFGRRLQVFSAGRLLLDWNGDPRRLPEVVGPRHLGLSNWSGGYRVSQLELQPLLEDIDAEDLMAATARQRHPIPAMEMRQPAEAELMRLLERRLTEARTTRHRANLAEQLLESARQPSQNLAEQFVLLCTVRDLAADIGHWTAALQAIDLMADRFQVDALQMKLATLRQSVDNAKGAAVFASIALSAAATTDQAVARDDYGLALELARTAMTAATKSRVAHLREMADAKREKVELLQQWWQTLEQDRVTLGNAPRDPEARTAVGKFLCFAKWDWIRGLDYLASTSKPGLKQVAELELADPQEMEALTELGDAWWSLSPHSLADERCYFQLRARHWYQRAVDESHGVSQLRLKERILEIDREVLGSERFYLTDMKEIDTKMGPWGLGKFGRLGSVNRTEPIVIRGATSPRGLGMHPHANSFAFAQYHLDGNFTTFVTSAAIEGTGAAGLVTFYVYGDGKTLWQSSPMQKSQQRQRCVVRVRNIKLLELRAHVDGPKEGAHACWLEPYLLESSPPRGLILP